MFLRNLGSGSAGNATVVAHDGRAILIDWVLSSHGHLSNEQCAEALGRVGAPRTVILGHLSRDCNRPSLARRAAKRVLPRSTRLLVASQDEPTEAVQI